LPTEQKAATRRDRSWNEKATSNKICLTNRTIRRVGYGEVQKKIQNREADTSRTDKSLGQYSRIPLKENPKALSCAIPAISKHM